MSNLEAAGAAVEWPVELAGRAAAVHPGRRIVELIAQCTPFSVPVANPDAIGAYYAGVFALVPLAGPLAAGGAFHWGPRALAAAREGRGGAAHAWCGIVLAGVSLVVHAAAAVWLALATV